MVDQKSIIMTKVKMVSKLKIHYGRHQVNVEDIVFKIFLHIHCILGHGFWVGLVLIATGLEGIVAFRERTRPLFVGFTVLSVVSTILSFYLIMICIIPVQYNTMYPDTSRPRWQLIELILNALLIAVGEFGIIVGIISALIGSVFAGCWNDRQDFYPKMYSDEFNRLL
jgi:hypothetical protein